MHEHLIGLGGGVNGPTHSATLVSAVRYQQVPDRAVTASEDTFLSSTLLP
jgi:hypothetical protein